MEHAEFGGNMYGTSAQAVLDVQNAKTQDGTKKRALLDIDTQVSFIDERHGMALLTMRSSDVRAA